MPPTSDSCFDLDGHVFGSKRRCRVLHIASMLYSGGVERWLVDLCMAGASLNIAMDIAVLHQNESLFARRAHDLGINVFLCPADNPLVFIRNLRRLLREKGPYDAVHAHIHAFGAFVVLAASLEGVPVRVVTSHNVVRNSGLTRRTYLKVSRLLIRKFATAATAPSPEAIEDLLGSGWRNDPRRQVIPYGINLEPFRSEIPTTATREAFGIPRDAFVLGSVGRLTAEKNSEFLVDILREVLHLRPNAYLLLIGEGPLRERLECKAAEGGFRDRLILAGVRSDVPALLRSVVNIFVFPSPPPPRGNEALPIAVVEAQAAGLPTILSDGVPGAAVIIPELVKSVCSGAGAEVWAKAAVDSFAHRTPEMPSTAIRIMEKSDFNHLQNVTTLAALYGATQKHPTTLS